MTIVSGKFGAIDSVSTVRNWNLTLTEALQRILASNTFGASARIGGLSSWNGSFQQFGGNPAVFPGKILPFQGYCGPDSNVLGGTGTVYAGDVICDSYSLEWNFGSGAALQSTSNFTGTGELEELEDQDAILDDTDVDAPEMCGLKIEVSTDAENYTEMDDVEIASLSITAENSQYANSGTNCWMQSLAGPLEATLALTIHSNVFKWNTGDNLAFKLFTGDTEFWLFEWFKVANFSNLSVNNESGELEKYVANLEFNGTFGSTRGRIESPGAVVEWEAAYGSGS